MSWRLLVTPFLTICAHRSATSVVSRRILVHDFGPGMTPEARDHLQRIDDAVIRMGLLVDGLLSLGKLGRQSLCSCAARN